MGIGKCRLLFWECRDGIYAYAGAGCLKAKNACVRTAHTLHLGFKFMSPIGRVCGAATHAVSGDAGYGLLSYFDFNLLYLLFGMKQRSSENGFTVFRRPFYYVLLEQNVGWVANPTFCEI